MECRSGRPRLSANSLLYWLPGIATTSGLVRTHRYVWHLRGAHQDYIDEELTTRCVTSKTAAGTLCRVSLVPAGQH